MANFGLFDKPYIKLGTNSDTCYICVKDECSKEHKDAHDVIFEHRGKLTDKFVFYIRRSGQDTCICFDCFKKLYETIIKGEMPEEVLEDVQAVEETQEAVTTEETSKKNTKKQSK